MAEDTFLIDLRQVSFAYAGGGSILNGLDFQLRAGEKVGIVGSNGCGKTTFLHLLMGLILPGSGSVRLFGEEMRAKKDFDRQRTRLGLLFQDADDQLFSPTVLDDVAFGPLNLGLSVDEARDRAVRTLAGLGLAGFENRLTHRLSGGEKKLVSLATVLSMQPRVLLLDEPTNGLDPQTRDRIIEILGSLPTARIIISHDWDFLARTTSRFMTVKDGRLVSDIPHLPHRHVHAHPLGGEPHHHHPAKVARPRTGPRPRPSCRPSRPAPAIWPSRPALPAPC